MDLLRDLVPFTGLVSGPLSALGLAIGVCNALKNGARRRRAVRQDAVIVVSRTPGNQSTVSGTGGPP